MRTENTRLVIVGAVLGTASYALLAFDRTFFSMVSNPTAFDRGLARIVWGACLLLYFLYLPARLSVSRARMPPDSWPTKALALLSAGIAIVWLFFDFLPRWPAVFNSDLELMFLLYLTSSIAYVLALGGVVGSLGSRQWTRAMANLAVTVGAGFVIFGTSWLVIYFE